jgi:hypothetical protein
MTAECPIVNKVEHDLALHKLRVNRLRRALEFIRDHTHSRDAQLYAASALEADEMML